MKAKKIVRRQTMIEERRVAFGFGEGNVAPQICDRCGGDSLMFRPEVISWILRMPTREIYRRIEAGNIHFLEENENQVLVCAGSLDQDIDPEQKRSLLEGNTSETVTRLLPGKNPHYRKFPPSD